MSRPRKPHSGSLIARLNQAQRDRLEQWLFAENLAYRVVSERAQAEFGVTLHPGALQQYYRKNACRKNLESVAGSARHANAVVNEFTNHPSAPFKALVQMAGKYAFDLAMENGPEKKTPEQLAVISDFIRVLGRAQRDDIYLQKHQLDREKWEFDVARTCVAHLTELHAITANNSLDEDSRLQAIRRRLFGENLPA